jgi:hypothetical protein
MMATHPGKKHKNSMLHKSGKPRLKPMNIGQLTALLDKTQRHKEKAKITREIARKQKVVA